MVARIKIFKLTFWKKKKVGKECKFVQYDNIMFYTNIIPIPLKTINN